jgi:hypothetical protein
MLGVSDLPRIAASVAHFARKFAPLAPDIWPEAAVCAFLGAVEKLARESETDCSPR